MSCKDCDKRAAQAVMGSLRTAAAAHGYELWSREGTMHLEVLAIPTGPSHGTPEDLVDAFKEQSLKGLPLPPSRARELRAKDRRSVKPARRNEAGHVGYLIDGQPPIELVFLKP